MLQLQEEKTLKKARSALLRLLGYRGRSRREAEEYLQRKGFDSDVVDTVLKEMEAWRYIDDRSLTGELIESFLRRGWGPLRARFVLLSRGIPRPMAEEGIGQFYSPEVEESLARKALAGRMEPGAEDVDRGALRRHIAYLKRRGFHDQVIIKALRERCTFFDC